MMIVRQAVMMIIIAIEDGFRDGMVC